MKAFRFDLIKKRKEMQKIALKDFDQAVLVRESLSTKIETIKVCHALVQNPKFFSLLLQIDIDEAARVQSSQCSCGAVLHTADYPRKPRSCPAEVRPDFESRFSFCCSQCRKRTTSMSVRFLGRRVYLGLIVVLMSVRRTTLSASAVQTM